ncbi:phytoene desaturase family protein [Desertimonas flava]|uniref:phytoene desaturase family protein n=1 Tax=Desertimonas flava TaxID=2064846 RepID=UPI000E341128
MSNGIVVGSGPNGLMAAIVLARAGLDVEVIEASATIGGGMRSAELTVPGVLHDVCSATHPTALASPALQELAPDLERHGLRWRWPAVDIAHPLDGGRAGVMVRSLDETCAGLGKDGGAWRRTFGPLTDHFAELVTDAFRPILHVPAHPIRLAGFGLEALRPATWVARRWRSDEARALFAGAAAHIIQPLTRPLSASVGLMLTANGHAHGWPVAEGGSQKIAAALAGVLADAGGRITTGRRVSSIDELAGVDVVMLDTSPQAAADIVGDRLPRHVARAYRRYKQGPAAFKLDLAVDGGIPWTNEACRRAGTVHVGGTLEQIVASERAVSRGTMVDDPFMLVCQQYLADPTRSSGTIHPVWAYAHVPNGYTGDASEAILRQIERFAPGVRERIVARVAIGPAGLEAYNANYVGGDIATGASDPRQTLFRPRVAVDPYFTGVPGVYVCSAATPPGAGVHGMGGANAARAALRRLR